MKPLFTKLHSSLKCKPLLESNRFFVSLRASGIKLRLLGCEPPFKPLILHQDAHFPKVKTFLANKMQLAISGTSEGIFKLLELHSSHDHTAKASKNHTLTRTGSSTKQLQDFSNYFQ